MRISDYIGTKATYIETTQCIIGSPEHSDAPVLIADISNKIGIRDEQKQQEQRNELGRWLAEAINEKLNRENISMED